MSENALISKIIKKAEAERDAILAEGDEKIRRMTEEANAAAKKRSAELLSSAEADAADIRRTGALTDQLDRRKKILHAKKEALDAAFAGALHKLTALPGDDQLRLVQSLIVKNAPKGDFLLQVSEKDRALYTEDVLQGLEAAVSEKVGADVSVGLCDQPADIAGGAVIIFDAYDVDLSFEELLSGVREKTEADIADILF